MRNAEGERPGAVHLELPEDIVREESEARVILMSRFDIPHASQLAIETAVGMIQNAAHPLLMVGAGANRKQTCRALTAFIEKAGIPFFSTQMSKGVVDERHPRFLGNAAVIDPVYYPQQGVIGDIADSIIRLTEHIAPSPNWSFSRFMEVETAHKRQLRDGTEDLRFPVYSQRLVAQMRKVLPLCA